MTHVTAVQVSHNRCKQDKELLIHKSPSVLKNEENIFLPVRGNE